MLFSSSPFGYLAKCFCLKKGFQGSNMAFAVYPLVIKPEMNQKLLTQLNLPIASVWCSFLPGCLQLREEFSASPAAVQEEQESLGGSSLTLFRCEAGSEMLYTWQRLRHRDGWSWQVICYLWRIGKKARKNDMLPITSSHQRLQTLPPECPMHPKLSTSPAELLSLPHFQIRCCIYIF